MEGDLEDGNDDNEVLRLLIMILPLKLEVVPTSFVPTVPFVVGCCMIVFVVFDLKSKEM